MTEDQSASVYESIAGGPELLEWFGRVPSFHDAEIIGLSLNRTTVSSLVLHAWNMTNVIGADGYYVNERHAVVTFFFEEIVDLLLEGFSPQNVIGGLSLQSVSAEANAHSEAIEVSLEDCYGLSGYVRARGVSVCFASGAP